MFLIKEDKKGQFFWEIDRLGAFSFKLFKTKAEAKKDLKRCIKLSVEGGYKVLVRFMGEGFFSWIAVPAQTRENIVDINNIKLKRSFLNEEEIVSLNPFVISKLSYNCEKLTEELAKASLKYLQGCGPKYDFPFDVKYAMNLWRRLLKCVV